VFIEDGLAGIIRHEQGHYIHTSMMAKSKSQEWDRLYSKISGLESKQNFHNKDMGYDKDTPIKQISSYSQSNSMEGFAEVFQLMTHPTFNRKKYKKEVQPLFDFMEKNVL
jgi:hypothetical protein